MKSRSAAILVALISWLVAPPFNLTGRDNPPSSGETGILASRRQALQSVREARVSTVGGHSASQKLSDLPVGVFDSGTGGLAVLEQILKLDQFDNRTQKPLPKGDGKPDFEAEQFVFLGDQANMPYGNYASAGKSACLVDLVLNDAVFLLDTAYYRHARAAAASRDKRPAKAIVIACNTATAHAKRAVESLIAEAGVAVNVCDVIDGGARGVIEALGATGGGTVGVIATRGTCDSCAYPAAIEARARKSGAGDVVVVQQGSLGLAGAIDGVHDFILLEAATDIPRADYRGPSLTNEQALIDPALLLRYQFDFSNHRMLWEGPASHPTVLQINAIENYVAFEVVSLLEKLRINPPAKPLAAIVLGCTHFPYFTDLFRAHVERLRNYQENGRYLYRDLLDRKIKWIDPAIVTARQLYFHLAADQLLQESGTNHELDKLSEFYLTVPNPAHPDVRLDAAGGFTYEYKYGRDTALGATDFRIVPLTTGTLSPSMASRLERQLPAVWALLQDFSTRSPKTRIP